MGNIKLISVFMFFAVLLMVPSISSAQMVIYSEDFSGTPDWTGTGSATIISDAVQIGNGGDGSARVPSGTVDISNYDNVSVQFDLSNLLLAGNDWEDNDFIDLVCTWAGGTSPGSYTVRYGRIDSTPLTPPEGDDAGSALQLISGGLGNPATIAIGATSTITVCDQTIVPNDATSIYLTVSLDRSTDNERIGVDNVEFQGDPTVPTLTEWGMIIFMVLAGLGAMYYMRRQRITTS